MNMPELTPECHQVDAELDKRFGSAASELSEPARRHLEQCERCRKLNAWMENASSSVPCAPEVYAAVQSKLLASLRPVSPRPPLWAIACRFGIVFFLVAFPAIGMLGPAGFRKM